MDSSESESGVSHVFRDLADVLEPLETRYQITTAEPVDEGFLGGGTVSMQVGVQIPFLDERPDRANVELTTTGVQLQDDGTLQVEFHTTVTSSETTADCHSVDEHQQQPESDTETPKPNATSPPDTDDEKRSDSPPTPATTAEDTPDKPEDADANHSAAQSAPAEQDPADGEETAPESDESVPAYQDPAQLRTVYDVHETFAEMTEALDVAVTPQTVRRYMIQYGIHQPASNTGSRPAETLLETDPDTIEADGGPSGRASLWGTDRSGSGPSGPRPSADESDDDQPADTPSGQRDHVPGSDTEPGEDAPTELGQTEPPAEDDATGRPTDPDESTQPDPTVTHQNGASPPVDAEAVAAAVDLPEHLTLDEVRDAVHQAKTLYDAQQQLELNRERAHDLLRELDLLDLVHSRLANRTSETQTIEEINHRITAKFAAYDDQGTDGTSHAHSASQ